MLSAYTLSRVKNGISAATRYLRPYKYAGLVSTLSPSNGVGILPSAFARGFASKSAPSTTPAENTKAAVDTPHLVLIDGSGLIYRSHFAMSKKAFAFTDPQGRPTSALHAFVGTMMTLRGDLPCSHFAVIFDAPGKNFRHTLFTEYKQNRQKTPDDLVMQFPLFRSACDAFGFRYVELEGYEADDIIATLATQATSDGCTSTIVSTDKDLMQLVSPAIDIYDPYKRVRLTSKDVYARFGVEPRQVVDVQALQGDQADNIPGVPGIGPKTAAKLIQEHDTLEGVFAALDRVTPNRVQKLLRVHQDIAIMSKKLTQLDADVPLMESWSSLAAAPPSAVDVKAFFRSLGLRKHIAKFDRTFLSTNKASLVSANSPQESLAQADGTTTDKAVVSEYTCVTTIDVLDDWIARARAKGVVAFDTETDSLDVRQANIIGFSLAIAPGKACYVPVAHRGSNGGVVDQISLADAAERLRDLLTDPAVVKVAHNLSYDLHVLMPHLGPDVELANCHDTLLLSYALVTGLYRHNLDSLAYTMFGHSMIKYEDVVPKGATFDHVAMSDAVEYAAEDADYTLRLYHSLWERLRFASLDRVYNEIDLPFEQTIFPLEQNGLRVDFSRIHAAIKDVQGQMQSVEDVLYHVVGEAFNPASHKQVRAVLFDKLGRKPPRSRSSSPALNVAALQKIAHNQDCSVARGILEWKGLNSRLFLLQKIEARLQEGYLYPSYHRISSDSLPTSKVPTFDCSVSDTTGHMVMSAVIPSDIDGRLVTLTFRDLPIQALAAMLSIEDWQQVLESNACLFTHLTKKFRVGSLFKRHGITSPCDAMRIIVYDGIIGGQNTSKLASRVGLPIPDTDKLVSRFLKKYPAITDYHDVLKQAGKKTGFASALSGRRFYYLGSEREFLQSTVWQGVSPPLIGNVADFLKLFFTRTPDILNDALQRANVDTDGPMIQPYAITHDQLVFDVAPSTMDDKQLHCVVHDVLPSIANSCLDTLGAAAFGHSPGVRVSGSWGDAWEDRQCVCGTCETSYHYLPRPARRGPTGE